MPVTIEPTEIEDLTRVALSGTVAFAEFLKALNTYGKKGPTRLELYDVRKLEGERFSTADIDLLVDYFRRHPKRRPAGSKTAVVIFKTVDLGLSRMVSILSEGVVTFKIEAFRSVEDVMDWLARK
jgi:hypothetical protein